MFANNLKWLLLGSSLLLGLAFAQFGKTETIGSIMTPSKNIWCQVNKGSGYANKDFNVTTIECEVGNSTAKMLPKPKDCEFDWGFRFGMNERGKASGLCHSDVLYNPKYQRMEYGETRKMGRITCDLTKTRLRCVNLDKRGFELSRAVQRLF